MLKVHFLSARPLINPVTGLFLLPARHSPVMQNSGPFVS